MNIFVLSSNTWDCVHYHNDAHVRKMTVEYAQIMCTVLREYRGVNDDTLYKSTDIHHPSVKWAAECDSNLLWLYKLWYKLAQEFTYRFENQHRTFTTLNEILFGYCAVDAPPAKIAPPQCMPEKYKTVENDWDSCIHAYRSYYHGDKNHLAKWSRRGVPCWYNKVAYDQVADI